ncbi:MAG: hypothetical protein MHMPM18_003732, partial [Marteilia pararefringens]
NYTLCPIQQISLKNLLRSLEFAKEEQNDFILLFDHLEDLQKHFEKSSQHDDLLGRYLDPDTQNFHYFYLLALVHVLCDSSSISDYSCKTSLRKMREKCRRICNKQFDNFRLPQNYKQLNKISRLIRDLYKKYREKYRERLIDAKWLDL